MAKPDPMQSLAGLDLVAKRLVDGLYTGRHASSMRGAGIEFHDYRPYSPGDDLRGIDWKRFGRTDRYYLKRYRKETELNLHVALDSSASMGFAAIHPADGQPSKFAIAQQLAAALLTLAIRRGDRAGLSLLDQSIRLMHPPTGSLRQLPPMIASLEQARVAQGPADLAAALGTLCQTLSGRKGLVAVITDLLDEPDAVLAALDRLRFAGHEVVVFQVLSPDELSLSNTPAGLNMIPAEQGVAVQTQPRMIAARYRQLMQQHVERLHRSLSARGIDHVMVNTAAPLVGVLRDYLIKRASHAR